MKATPKQAERCAQRLDPAAMLAHKRENKDEHVQKRRRRRGESRAMWGSGCEAETAPLQQLDRPEGQHYEHNEAEISVRL